jgi:hypothetical protein
VSQQTFCRDVENWKKTFFSQICWNWKNLESSLLYI